MWLADLRYAIANGLDIGPDLTQRLRAAIAKLNPKPYCRGASRDSRQADT